ncbi:MAG: glycosyltransferase, partial [Candidatus Omnitrophica bacterium]|nr:glycosyltransferase [Candidatus Omnitrophota bacterium]
MKILQVVHSFPPFNMAGTEVYTYNLSRELAKRHKVFIFHRINNRRQKEYELTNTHHNGLSIYTINNTFRHCDSFEMTYRNKAIDDSFDRVLDQVKPDVVHIQHLLFLSTALIEEIKKRNIPVLFTLHDYWLICHRGQLIKNDLTICVRSSVSECKDCLQYLLSIRKNSMYVYNMLKNRMP